jgi:hypothetical protein
MSRRRRRELRERLDPLIRKKSLSKNRRQLGLSREYSAVTDDGLLRAAVFKGLRDDLGNGRHLARDSGTGYGICVDGFFECVPIRVPNDTNRITTIGWGDSYSASGCPAPCSRSTIKIPERARVRPDFETTKSSDRGEWQVSLILLLPLS